MSNTPTVADVRKLVAELDSAYRAAVLNGTIEKVYKELKPRLVSGSHGLVPMAHSMICRTL